MAALVFTGSPLQAQRPFLECNDGEFYPVLIVSCGYPGDVALRKGHHSYGHQTHLFSRVVGIVQPDVEGISIREHSTAVQRVFLSVDPQSGQPTSVHTRGYTGLHGEGPLVTEVGARDSHPRICARRDHMRCLGDSHFWSVEEEAFRSWGWSMNTGRIQGLWLRQPARSLATGTKTRSRRYGCGK